MYLTTLSHPPSHLVLKICPKYRKYCQKPFGPRAPHAKYGRVVRKGVVRQLDKVIVSYATIEIDSDGIKYRLILDLMQIQVRTDLIYKN